MSHNSEDLVIKQYNPIAALLSCQTTVKSRKSFGSALLDRLLTPARSLFLTARVGKKGNHDAPSRECERAVQE